MTIHRGKLGTISLLVCAVGVLAASRPWLPIVTGTGATAEPSRHRGACPVTLTLRGHIRVSEPTTVRYRWVRSDRVEMPEETLEFEAAGRKEFTATWTRDERPGYPRMGWAMVQVLAPERRFSGHAQTVVHCE